MPKGTFEANARVTNRIWEKLNALDRDAFGRLIAARDYLATWQFIEREILALR